MTLDFIDRTMIITRPGLKNFKKKRNTQDIKYISVNGVGCNGRYDFDSTLHRYVG